MQPAHVIETLRADGIHLHANGDRVVAVPASSLTDVHRHLIRQHKAELLASLSAANTDDDLEMLRTAAGPDWPAIKGDPGAIAALRTALDVERARAEGIPPEGYTQASHCGGCGDVLLWQGAPARVAACPWCQNRLAGRPIPRPATPPPAPTVTCGTCEHYIANEHGAGGLGRCGIDAPAARIPPSLWPRGEHRCAAWEAVP